MHDVSSSQVLGDPVGHLPAQLRQVIVGQAAVEQSCGVVDLAVPDEVHDRPGLCHGDFLSYSDARAAAVAAPGSACTIRSNARSSWAVEQNQPSYALGGR